MSEREADLAKAIKNLGSPCATPEHGVYSQEIHRGDCSQCTAKILTTWGQHERDEAERGSANDLRAQGWAVAIHNDYRLNGLMTFWLLTKENISVKGEGITDTIALDQIRDELRRRRRAGEEK